METQVRTPQAVFNLPQRLIVPLFQRPYVWNQDNQWEPLWSDVVRVAQRQLDKPQDRHQPHFLGAVVLQQLQNPVGQLQECTIIDGQQRLTTLQLLLHALQGELQSVGAQQPAMRLRTLVFNDAAFQQRSEDRFKVWPTNRDRVAFTSVMAGEPPLNYAELQHRGCRLVQAHEYFAQRAREWLRADGVNVQLRAVAVERAVRELIQLVVIDLAVDENAQEIFETLNARGAQLTAADLIKNFVFQRLTEDDADVETAYKTYWKDFETGFWEAEISAGRVKHQRSSMFLNQWLIAKTGEEILAREVFYRFKSYAEFESGVTMAELLGQIHRVGKAYQDFVRSSDQLTGPLKRLELFAYRTGVMESEVVKPLVVFLLDPDDSVIPPDQMTKALDVIESWLVRRMLVRATSKSYAQVIAELIGYVRKNGRNAAGDVMERYLRSQPGSNWYWPDDDEVRGELRSFAAYRRLSRSRARMVLEAIEDFDRGWRGEATGLGGERVTRGTYTIEHILPRRWEAHWPLPNGSTAEQRDSLVDTFGNLTLLTGKLNTRVSNGPWDGPEGKRSALAEHDILMLNRQLLKQYCDGWDDKEIRARGELLIDAILSIWTVPEGHRSGATRVERLPGRKIDLADLIGAGMIDEGATLYAGGHRWRGHTASNRSAPLPSNLRNY